MQQTLTKSLILFISGVYLLSMVQPSLQNDLALWGYGIEQGQIYRLFTVALMHDQLSDIPYHLAFNMLALHSLGTQIESVLGKARYFAIFFFSLLTGSLTSAYFLPFNGYSIGVSGAVFGLFGAILVMGRRYGVQMRAVLVTVGINLAIGFTIPGIDWRAHVGGLIGGAAMTRLLIHK